ncbi:hypothetical protein LWM68_45155 [Niabella sp. W65]|nr:hypothetical protein [Niabella sp. W65]MCH7369293.1 hypothetical protein [Niabella sp. W65]ULT46242.1 hypothetical protein KRR40_16860 [Niabella sp. I65]
MNQQSAHERVLYQQMLEAIDGTPIATQSSMFPPTLEMSPQMQLYSTNCCRILRFWAFL